MPLPWILPILVLLLGLRCQRAGPVASSDPEPPQAPGGTDPDTLGPGTPPDTTPVVPGLCAGYAHLRVINVSTTLQLTSALRGARSGDLILLASGLYQGGWLIANSGTAAAPITLCGSSAAVLDAGSLSDRDVITLRASYWRLVGFTITDGLRGVYAERAQHNSLDSLTIFNLGQEGVQWSSFSSHNVVQNSRIHDTGRVIAEYGEGVYFGHVRTQWCTYTGCEPDRSDSNEVRNNVIGPNVTAEHIDAKEGTTGGIISGNIFDGRGMVRSRPWVDSWVEINGSGYAVSDNQGSVAPVDGFQVIVGLRGWGNDNVFVRNHADIRADGYGFRIDSGTSGNRVGCDNVVVGAGKGLANTACQ